MMGEGEVRGMVDELPMTMPWELREIGVDTMVIAGAPGVSVWSAMIRPSDMGIIDCGCAASVMRGGARVRGMAEE